MKYEFVRTHCFLKCHATTDHTSVKGKLQCVICNPVHPRLAGKPVDWVGKAISEASPTNV